jgi:hypothetical protein
VKLTPPTPEEVSRALELLRPEKLLMVREDLADLDDELKAGENPDTRTYTPAAKPTISSKAWCRLVA